MSELRLREIRLAKKRFYDIQHDFINSKYHNFGNHLKIFVDFCESNKIMREITEPLKYKYSIDIPEWWKSISRRDGYELPTDLFEQASVLYRFILGINSGIYNFITFCSKIYGHRGLDANVFDFNDDITSKLVRYLNHKLNELEQKELNKIKVPKQKIYLKNIQLLSLFITIIIPIGGIIAYGYHNRPIIDYKLGCQINIDESINLEHTSLIEIEAYIRNRGNIDCPMKLIITLNNATFKNIKEERYIKLKNENTILEYHLRLQKGQTNYKVNLFYIEPLVNASYFNIHYKLKHISSGNILTDLFKRFADVIGYDPIYIAFRQTKPGVYIRID